MTGRIGIVAIAAVVVAALTIVTPVFAAVNRDVVVVESAAAGKHHIIHLSDFHYDPLFGTLDAVGPCKNSSVSLYGLPGCDSSLHQIRYVLEDVAATAKDLLEGGSSVLVTYTGDWLRHQMNQLKDPDSVAETIMTTVSHLLSELLGNVTAANGGQIQMVPHLSIPLSLGNEDFIPDYHFNVSKGNGNHPMLVKFSDIFHHHGLLSKEEATTFARCGYYHRDVSLDPNGTSTPTPLSNVRIISLNTLVYDKSLSPPDTKLQDPCGQFAWLTQQLNSSRSSKQRVIIQSHIPPGPIFWHSQYYDQYKALLQEYNDIIATQFYGHIHRMSYQALSENDDVKPIFIGGPITRVSHTNPCYELLQLNSTTGEPIQVTQRFLNESDAWIQGKTIPGDWNITALDTSSLYSFAHRMRGDDSAGRANFLAWFPMFNGGIVSESAVEKCTEICQRTWACSLIAEGVLQSALCLL